MSVATASVWSASSCPRRLRPALLPTTAAGRQHRPSPTPRAHRRPLGPHCTQADMQNRCSKWWGVLGRWREVSGVNCAVLHLPSIDGLGEGTSRQASSAHLLGLEAPSAPWHTACHLLLECRPCSRCTLRPSQQAPLRAGRHAPSVDGDTWKRWMTNLLRRWLVALRPTPHVSAVADPERAAWLVQGGSAESLSPRRRN